MLYIDSRSVWSGITNLKRRSNGRACTFSSLDATDECNCRRRGKSNIPKKRTMSVRMRQYRDLGSIPDRGTPVESAAKAEGCKGERKMKEAEITSDYEMWKEYISRCSIYSRRFALPLYSSTAKNQTCLWVSITKTFGNQSHLLSSVPQISFQLCTVTKWQT